MRFRDYVPAAPAVGQRYNSGGGRGALPLPAAERARRQGLDLKNAGPNFTPPGEREPPRTLTMRQLSETLHRAPDDVDAVSTRIEGGGDPVVAELMRRASELRAERAAEAAEAESSEHEAAEQEAQRMFLQSMLLDDPGLVLEMIVDYLKAGAAAR